MLEKLNERSILQGTITRITYQHPETRYTVARLDTLRVLSEEPLRILEVDGIGEVRARRIMQAWQEQRDMQDMMIFLQGHDMSASMALRIYHVFGSETIRRIRENPYTLTQEVH